MKLFDVLKRVIKNLLMMEVVLAQKDGASMLRQLLYVKLNCRKKLSLNHVLHCRVLFIYRIAEGTGRKMGMCI